MIKSINIENFGSFSNFVWNNSVRDNGNNVAKFKKLNIIYGRNYSGKTTLSRVFRSLQTGKFPDNYENPKFTVSTEKGTITHEQIPTTDYHIRVYNKDFIDDHLGFLRDNAGKITPFAVIGSENKIIESEIKKIEIKLGNVIENSGIRYKYACKYDALKAKQDAKSKLENGLTAKLTNKATQPPNGIKHNAIYKDPNYNTPKIKNDIDLILNNNILVLSDKERKEKEGLLGETALPDIDIKLDFIPELSDLYERANNLLQKEIAPTHPIQELLGDPNFQSWVKEGILHHKDKRKKCGFCGQNLPVDLWKRLDEHFNEDSAKLEIELQELIEIIEKHSIIAQSILTIDSENLYLIFHDSFIKEKELLSEEILKYCEILGAIIKDLRGRKSDIFKKVKLPRFRDNSLNVHDRIMAINLLIDKNNKKTKSLAEDKEKARTELRINEIAQFIKDIDFDGEKMRLVDLERDIEAQKIEVAKIQDEVQSLEKKIVDLQIQLKDEKKGADKVNEYLNHYFGHEGIRLEAFKDNQTSQFKFQILRNDKLAYNLSEGECSLVSFCYFIAKLEDSESYGKELVVYIDDPVSSLDSNHVFFVYSLIESIIARPEEDAEGRRKHDADGNNIFRYKQLFISTHNLDFLKYLKKLSQPKNNNESFLVTEKDHGSSISLMPHYLKNYITEFNYLFSEIYICMDPNNAATQHHCFYNFGNNLRKFLEAFLYFKYPFSISDKQDYDRRIKKFFKDEPNADALVLRLTNEYSHLGGIFDRSIQPIDHAEISKLAQFVMKKINDNDRDQFKSLLESIEKPDPFSMAS